MFSTGAGRWLKENPLSAVNTPDFRTHQRPLFLVTRSQAPACAPVLRMRTWASSLMKYLLLCINTNRNTERKGCPVSLSLLS